MVGLVEDLLGATDASIGLQQSLESDANALAVFGRRGQRSEFSRNRGKVIEFCSQVKKLTCAYRA